MSNTPSVAPYGVFAQRLSLLADGSGQSLHSRGLLTGGLRGIEKESLRVTPQGTLAMTPHPRVLGSALTHPEITTDYSEALLEVITPAEPDAAMTLAYLDTLHRYVYSKLGDELLWNESMPCALPADDQIPIAEYGSSNIGRLKHVYRRGLALRYGRSMQCIAGIHYNYSLDEDLWRVLREQEQSDAMPMDFQSERYLALLRNFRRYSWLLMLLFGASPAVSTGFLRGQAHQLKTLDADTLFLPYATSLRMSDLGYHNSPAQAGMALNYDSLPAYVESLARAVSQPHPAYEKIGTRHGQEWVQINTNVLQIENEFYSTIRPKRVIYSGERPLCALSSRGIQYVEVRCLDIDPFEPTGIALPTARFLDAFLLFCALQDSPLFSRAAHDEANDNFAQVVKQGRRPGLQLRRDGKAIDMQEWARELFEQINVAAQALDGARAANAASSNDTHCAAVAAQQAKLDDLSLTPSARVLATMGARKQSLAQFALELSREHARNFRARPLDAEQSAYFEDLARSSLAEQQRLEREEAGDFDAYIEAYRVLNCSPISQRGDSAVL
jgi:glutamate--cysteine ligase